MDPVSLVLRRHGRVRSSKVSPVASLAGRVVGASIVLIVALLTVPLVADAQPAGKVWRVGVLTSSPRSAPFVQALEQRLRELGYAEGRNLAIDFRAYEGRLDRLPELAAELVGRRPDVLVVSATPAAIAAKNATRTIPIVMAAVGEPVASGIVPGLGRPGGNITGVSLLNAELSGKALQLLKEAVPSLSRVSVFANSQNRVHEEILEATRAAAGSLRVTVDVLDIRGPDGLPGAFQAVTRQRAEGLLLLPDPVTLPHRKIVLEFAARRRLPAMYPFREMVDEGGLMCYGPNLVENFRAAAGYVDKILKGATVGDLPISQAAKFDLVINLKTARTLGLTIPPSLLLRADEVIQ
jgi:putative ABC transport system substrate-binding protein